jgi:hypothetical protein
VSRVSVASPSGIRILGMGGGRIVNESKEWKRGG